MSRMTEVQAQALAAFVSRVRTDWNAPGIVAALEKAAPTADVHDVACALIRLSADPTVKTPGMLAQSGPWWVKADGTKAPRRGDHTMRCPEHGQPYLRCTDCAAVKSEPPPEDVQAEIRAAIEAAKTTHHRSDAEKAAREARKK